MMDPTMLNRLAQIRQQEFLDQAAQERAGTPIIQWSRLFEPIHAFLQRRSRRSAASQSLTTLGQITLDECPCE